MKWVVAVSARTECGQLVGNIPILGWLPGRKEKTCEVLIMNRLIKLIVAGCVLVCSQGYAAAPTTKTGPVLAEYKDKLYLVFQSADREKKIHVATVNKDGKINRSVRLGSSTSMTPALSEYKGKLWMAFRSADRSGHIYIQGYDGRGWSKAKKLEFTTQSGPALAEHDGRLHLVWRGKDNDKLYHAVYDGRRWSAATKLRNYCYGAPVLQSFHNNLYLVTQNRSRGLTGHWLTDNGWKVADNYKKIIRTAGRAPALSVVKGRLYAAMPVKDSGQVVMRSRHNTWQAEKDPDIYSAGKRRVGMASLDDDLYIAYTSTRSGKIKVERVKVQ